MQHGVQKNETNARRQRNLRRVGFFEMAAPDPRGCVRLKREGERTQRPGSDDCDYVQTTNLVMYADPSSLLPHAAKQACSSTDNCLAGGDLLRGS